MKKISLISFIALIIAFTVYSIVNAHDCDNLEQVMRKFRAAQVKLIKMERSGAPKQEIEAQKSVVIKLRHKFSELQNDMGQ